MSKPVHQLRLDHDCKADSFGRLFFHPRTAALTDLSDVKLLRCAVDTVRQLYRGRIRAEVFELFENSGFVSFADHIWHAGRIGRDSGYQYRLQNADLGIILLIKNYNVKEVDTGPHLKIEVSPHTIESHRPESLQKLLDGLANAVLADAEPNQCAVHIALDVQGWKPPQDTVQRMQCRSRRVRDISGIDSIEWSRSASVYGLGETYMFGAPNGVQLAIYNKSKQAKVIDKLDFWESLWNQAYADFDTPLYDDGQDVWRIELRYHHTIIQQFAEGSANTKTGEIIGTKTFLELTPHLDGLWQYGFEAFKLLKDSQTFDAAWTLFANDAHVETGYDSLLDETEYKRYYKTAAGFTGKNVELFMGNFVSLLAREKVGAQKAFDRLKEWECWEVIRDHFAEKGKTERDIYKWISEKLRERVVRWGKAV
ncbi:hypothetical protein VQ643_09825 [Pseudomonas sp. F1_0610]|uniref:hypothetical protein n=1 Tax=Pseudomonas sp. F1_0610 TaxID=3114284 RepID=UPI0039C49C61